MALGCTRNELLRRVSSKELTEWMAFGQLEPFGHRAMWGGFAMLAALTYNLNRPKGKKAAKPDDFMPKEPGEEMGWQDMMQHAKTVTEMFGGQTKRGG